MMTNPRQDSDTAETLAALLAQTGTPHGPPPTPDELRAWAAKTLEPARRAEIESHIAHDPAVFEHAMGFLDAAALKAAPARPVFALAATVLIAFAGAAYFFLNSTSSELPATAGTERSARSPIADWRHAAFRAGVEDTGALNVGSLNIEHCIDGDRCPELARALYDYGSTLAQLSASCSKGKMPATRSVASLRETRRTFQSSFELAPWSEPLVLALTSEELDCRTVDALLRAPTGAQ